MTKATRILAIILTILAGLAGALVWYGNNQRQAYLEAKGAAAVLTRQYEDYRAQAEKQRAQLQAEAAQARSEKAAALDRAQALETDKDRLTAALTAEKAKVAALPPDALAGSINLRIGAGLSWPMGGGLFSFTRPGAEGVLTRFLQGEADAAGYKAEKSISANLRTAISAAEREAGNLGQRLYITTNERDKAVLAWDADKAALKSLERAILGTKVKTFLIGAGVGAAAVIILNLVRGK
jgi:hypothetical protein